MQTPHVLFLTSSQEVKSLWVKVRGSEFPGTGELFTDPPWWQLKQKTEYWVLLEPTCTIFERGLHYKIGKRLVRHKIRDIWSGPSSNCIKIPMIFATNENPISHFQIAKALLESNGNPLGCWPCFLYWESEIPFFTKSTRTPSMCLYLPAWVSSTTHLEIFQRPA